MTAPAKRRIRGPDRPLLLTGEIFVAADAALRKDDDDRGMDEVERDRVLATWFQTLQIISETPAATAPGRRVKAAALLACARRADPNGTAFIALAMSVARDVLGAAR
jgi:hypothetical protein